MGLIKLATRSLRRSALCVGFVAAFVASALASYPSGPQITDRDAPGGITVTLQDYATLPASGSGATAQVARVNFMRPDPVDSSKYVVNDLNGNLYTLDKTTKTFATYLNAPSIFSNFDNNPGFAAGLVTFQFDPGFLDPTSPGYGQFYTTHTEIDPNVSSSEYRVGVLTEWKVPGDPSLNFGNPAVQPTHREMLRVTYTDNIHPLGDITFNPNAHVGDPDYRMMYISSGDGGAGESSTTSIRNQDQMLNNYTGKILRIQPNAITSPTSYSIPSDNPFASTAGANGEIWAYGFRNPHRLSWDAAAGKLIVDDIGLHSYEEVDIVHKGANYGYSRIEGSQVLNPSNQVSDNAALPPALPLITTDVNNPIGTIAPTYPVAEYSHRDGDAISSGFVYHGTKIPQLVGKYVFGDITTGRLFYTDYSNMLTQEGENGGFGDPTTMSQIHELRVMYSGNEDRVFDIVRSTFDLRNDGVADGDFLPGSASATDAGAADPYGVLYGTATKNGGRADIRWALGDDNELYLLSKSDGMIRALVPEPSTLLLAALGGIAMAGAAIRRVRTQLEVLAW